MQHGVTIEYICLYCEVTDAGHSDCELSEQEVKDSRHIVKTGCEDPLDGITLLLSEGEEIH